MKTISLDAEVIEALAGHYDEALRLIEERFDVHVAARGSEVLITSPSNGDGDRVHHVAGLLRQLGALHADGLPLSRDDLRAAVAIVEREPDARLEDHFVASRIRTPLKSIVPRTTNQRHYVAAMRSSDLVLGVGPAGTGKTYLAVAMAVSLLSARQIKRIVLARPAVEAGERLGFLPGDIAAKVDPYLRPLYDALHDLMESERTERLVEQGVIEIAPLAFMRGRTLNDAFVILDEAQNSTSEQMKMFLTRIGLGSRAVVTGDVTQIDLPSQKISGLVEACEVINDVDGVTAVRFDGSDVVRHPLVQRIITAYDRHESSRDDKSAVLDDAAGDAR